MASARGIEVFGASGLRGLELAKAARRSSIYGYIRIMIHLTYYIYIYHGSSVILSIYLTQATAKANTRVLHVNSEYDRPFKGDANFGFVSA